MRTRATTLLLSSATLGLAPGSHAGVEPEFKTRVSVTLRDEKDQPVPDADVSLLFSHVIDARSLERKGRTDLQGKFGAEEKIISSLMVTVAKDGFHPIHWDRALIRTDVDAKGINAFDAALQLRRRIHPEALHAKRVSTSIPAENSAVGFDLKAGDWVKPFGRGATPDFRLQSRREFTGYRFSGKRLEELREFSKAAHEARTETWTKEKFKEKQTRVERSGQDRFRELRQDHRGYRLRCPVTGRVHLHLQSDTQRPEPGIRSRAQSLRGAAG